MKLLSRFLAATSVVVFSVTAILASVNGAIFTTTLDGTAVNANIYDDKNDVYLNGGPQNSHGSLLSPDGLYYFQVTDPSGATLLSTDDLSCRQVVVAGGRITGVAPGVGCAHAVGPLNTANGTVPVQLMPYGDTPNPGGVYKAWITPVDKYAECKVDKRSFGFCDSESKTDNFKVRSSSPLTAFVQVCKFNDVNADGIKGSTEPFIAHWPITASGVDGGNVSSQTDDRGCTSFTFSGFSNTVTEQSVTISEGTFGPDWTQTAPSSCGDTPGCSIDAGAITIALHPGDNVAAPNFGNTNPFCDENCTPGELVATATAYPSLVRTYAWDITKAATSASITSASSTATAEYVVEVTHDTGTDSDWKAAGTIRIANPGGSAITNMLITATTDNGGVCDVTGGSSASIDAGSHEDFAYRCDFASAPAVGTVQVTATFADQSVETGAAMDFVSAVVTEVDASAVVSDSMVGELGTVTSTDPSPKVYTYSKEITGTAGTCTTTDNTASLLTNTTATNRAASQAVVLCVGANLSVTNTAVTTFDSTIGKSVDRTMVQQQGGSATFNYSVEVRESGWMVNGVIQVTNPNDWQSVTVSVSDTVAGGSCVITGGTSIEVAPSSTVAVDYSCSFASAPAASGVNNATISWDDAAAFTTSSSAASTASYSFAPLTIVDVFNDGVPVTLGTVTVPAALTTYAYPRTVSNAAAGSCLTLTNVASISGGTQSASQTAYACNTITGARTIGFWQNKNGQALITGTASTAGVCNLTPWLRQFAPFQDLAVTASCRTAAAYAMTLIKAANASGASMNAMLKAQMLASALDVYFSDPTLSGNTLAAPVRVGMTRIDLTKVCATITPGVCNGTIDASSAFGGNTSLTVMQMLLWQNSVSNAGGSLWYANFKSIQWLAKNGFDAINNEVARIAP